MEEKWYILAGTLIWTVVFLLIVLILIRLLKQYRLERRIHALNEADARRVALRFASISTSSSATLDIEPAHHPHPRTRWFHIPRRSRPALDVFTEPPRPYLPVQPHTAHGLTPEELQLHCPVQVHAEETRDLKEAGAECHSSGDGILLCAICLDDITYGLRKRVLPCFHAFHARCVQIWLQRSNKCPCCMKTVVLRDPTPMQDLNDGRLLGMPMPDEGGRRLGRGRRGPRSRFLGLWTFGNRQFDPEFVARITQTPGRDDRMVDLQTTVRAAERRNLRRAIGMRGHSVRFVDMSENRIVPNAPIEGERAAIIDGAEHPQVQQYSEQLRRSREIDNMVEATA